MSITYPPEMLPTSEDGVVIMDCPVCGGDGGGEVWTGYDPRNGEATGYWSVCGACEGKGQVEIETQSRTLEDLEAEDEATP